MHPKKGNLLTNMFTPKVISEPDPVTGQFNPFPAFPYTGELRPIYPLSQRREVPASIKHPDYAFDGVPRSEQTLRGRTKIDILDKVGQEGMRKVCRLGREVLDIAAAAIRPGITTDYIDEIVHKACMERNVRF
jgi:methionyl aminopeptidase